MEVSDDRIQFRQITPLYTEEPTGQGLINWKNISRESLRLAQAGINGINRMTGSEMELEVSADASGNSTKFRFRSRYMNVDAPLGNSD